MNKFCVNCKHYQDDRGIALCMRKSNEVDLVKGEPKALYCATERSIIHNDTCGLEGLYFKGKE